MEIIERRSYLPLKPFRHRATRERKEEMVLANGSESSPLLQVLFERDLVLLVTQLP